MGRGNTRIRRSGRARQREQVYAKKQIASRRYDDEDLTLSEASEDQQLLSAAISKKWLTDVPLNDLQNLLQSHQGTMKLDELAACVLRSGMTHEDPNVQQKSVTNLIRMHQQVQTAARLLLMKIKMEQPAKAQQHLHLHANMEASDRLNLIEQQLEEEIARRGLEVVDGESQDHQDSTPSEEEEDYRNLYRDEHHRLEVLRARKKKPRQHKNPAKDYRPKKTLAQLVREKKKQRQRRLECNSQS